jgi:pSer/pThr/pTyr-binding forkhead associated (FHA) protein
MDPAKLALAEASGHSASMSREASASISKSMAVSVNADTRDDDRHPAYTTSDADPGAHLVRLVVRRSKALTHGAVAVLDAREGGIQLGRDRCERGAPARVRVREMEVSKTHAVVYWDDGWFIVDLGSTLGTYVAHRGERDATRLAEPKCSSKPYALEHRSVLTIGTTTFVVHIHDDWPCAECKLAGNEQIALDDGTAEPAEPTDEPNPRLALDAGQRRGERQLQRKLELNALRDTLLGKEQHRDKSNIYVDRSAQRRRLHGNAPYSRPTTSTPPQTTPTQTPAVTSGPSQASRAMLAKQGWTPGSGLGRDASGIAQPIATVVRNDRVGLGAHGATSDPDADWKTRGRQRRWDALS